MLAVRSNDREAVLRALDNGADPNMHDKEGFTPLMYSVMYGFADKEIINALLAHGANVNARTKSGDNVLLVGIGDSGGVPPEFIELLLKAHADPNVANNFGRTPLMDAINHATDLMLLLQYGADPNAKTNYDGSSVFLQAVEAGNLDFAKMLLEHGADINTTRDSDGQTALQIAEDGGYATLVTFLRSQGAREPSKTAWPIYENVAYGYHIAFPPGGSVQAEDYDRSGNSGPGPLNRASSVVVLVPPLEYLSDEAGSDSARNILGIHIHASDNPTNVSLEEWIKSHGASQAVTTAKNAIWHGTPAVKTAQTTMGGEVCLYLGQTTIYSICRYDLSGDPERAVKAQDAVLQKVIDTFKVHTHAPPLTPATTAAEIREYTECGCGCCGGVDPGEKCLYHKSGDSLTALIESSKRNAPSPATCALAGCAPGIHYHYCD
ncbi:MAG: ankyrin repeat domain-containing protein [Pseudomonadota bacterium]|nr:ankyrin repeat domain-containing protein [Pseudomonadota bacterium]